jgi:uroporphyrinogen decarboxylase
MTSASASQFLQTNVTLMCLQTRRSVVPSITLIGFAGAPFTVACYMVAGGGSKDFAEVRRLAYTNPTLFADLIGLLAEATITYLAAQMEA